MSPNNTFVQQKKPNKLLVFVKNKVLPALVKFGNARHVAGIRDAFGTMIPLIIAGSIGILISSIVFGGNGSGYVSLFGLICKLANPHLA
jgi:PTS system cellobiose-specific IIC component